FLRKRLSPERFQKIHASFEKHEFWALMFPAMLPPPTPFKAVVLSAAAFEMSFLRFMLAIFAGRFFRFLILGLLTLKFGPAFIEVAGHVIAHDLKWVLVAIAVGLLLWLIWRRWVGRNAPAKRSATGMNSQRQRSKKELPGD